MELFDALDDVERLRKLLATGADLTVRNSGHHTALHVAAITGQVEAIRLLIASRADVEAVDVGNEETPLHSAAREGRVESIRLLVASGAKLEARCAHRETPLHKAAMSPHGVPGVHALVELGAEVDARNEHQITPLIAAAKTGQLETAKALVERGATREATFVSGETALDVAAKSGHAALEAMLRDPPIHAAAAAADVAALRQLLADGGDRLASDSSAALRATPLHFAAQANAAECMQVLIERGAPLDAQDSLGRTPLHWAAVSSTPCVDGIRLLMARGASTAVEDQRAETALDAARAAGMDEAAAVLEGFHSAEAKRRRIMQDFGAARTVHVLSTRYSGISFEVARRVKAVLEAQPGVLCFNPNLDNRDFEAGDLQRANAVWLKRWRAMLRRAQETGGKMYQLCLAPDGLSDMQEAEADMAQDKEVGVCILKFTNQIKLESLSELLQQLSCESDVGEASSGQLTKAGMNLTAECDALRRENVALRAEVEAARLKTEELKRRLRRFHACWCCFLAPRSRRHLHNDIPHQHTHQENAPYEGLTDRA
jgi:ankyrin repeat protein